MRAITLSVENLKYQRNRNRVLILERILEKKSVCQIVKIICVGTCILVFQGIYAISNLESV